jgi:hypothetical protein
MDLVETWEVGHDAVNVPTFPVLFVEIVKCKCAVKCILLQELDREEKVKLAEDDDLWIDEDMVMDLRIGVCNFMLEVVCLALDVLACKATLTSDALVIKVFFRGGGGVWFIKPPPSSSILSSSTCSSPSSSSIISWESRTLSPQQQHSIIKPSNDKGVNFESGQSFILIGLPAHTSIAIHLTGDISVGLLWREAETVLVLAAEDRDVVLWAIEQIEFAEELGTLLSQIEGLVCTLQLSMLMHILFAILLSALTLEAWGWKSA